jgi:hypothetical protein
VITSDDGNYDHLPQWFVTRQAAIDAAIAILNSTLADARPPDIDVAMAQADSRAPSPRSPPNSTMTATSMPT